MKGATTWRMTALILQKLDDKDYYRRVGSWDVKTREPSERLGKSYLLEDLGLQIDNQCGDVTARDHNKWKTFRII
jgi:hypothetical protein